MGAAFTAVPAMTSLTYYIPSICEVARPELGMVSPDRDGIAWSYPHLIFTLPLRGRVGSHRAKQDASRGGVKFKAKSLRHPTPPLRVDPRASFARLGPLQGRVRRGVGVNRESQCSGQAQRLNNCRSTSFIG